MSKYYKRLERSLAYAVYVRNCVSQNICVSEYVVMPHKIVLIIEICFFLPRNIIMRIFIQASENNVLPCVQFILH